MSPGDGTGSQVISGNNEGVVIVSVTGLATGNTIQGNFIGTDMAGTFGSGELPGGRLDRVRHPATRSAGPRRPMLNLISANHWGVILTGPRR